MWFEETTFYQIYPLGFCGCAHENAPAGADGASDVASAMTGKTGEVEPCETAYEVAAADVSDGSAAASTASERAQSPILKIVDWADYLASLHVGAVLLNPVFESDSHGYDTRDFRLIDRRLGTNGDFARVCSVLHEHGIRVVLDAVFNHVGRGFWAFRDVRERRWDSPYKDWFHISFEGDSCYGDGFWYEGWEGHFELVKLNLQNPAVVDYLLDCVRFWVEEFGIDGLRLDVAYMLDRGFMERLRSFVRELAPEFPLIGETLHGDYNQIVNDRMLDSCTNYECYKGLYSSFNSQNMFEIAHSLHRQFGGDPWCIYRGRHLLSFADNHDVPRLASILTDKACLQPAYGMLFGMPGIPCLYYGSEWAAEGTKGGPEGDWALRASFDVPAPNELTGFIKKLAALRAAGDAAARALNYGDYRNVQIQNKQLFFARTAEGAQVYVAVNAVAEPFTFHEGELTGSFVDLLADTDETVELEGALDLAPYEVRYLLRA